MQAPPPLDGIRVLDLTTGVAGPAATQMMAFLGAEVLRVTSALARRPRIADDQPSVNTLYLQKRSIRLNLADPRGLEIARRLVAHCDAVVENQRPGAVAKLGLGYDALRAVRPNVIAISLSTSGNIEGTPEVGYAPNFSFRAGVAHVSGYPGGPPGEHVNWPDLIAAHWAVYALLLALMHRDRTGEGQYLDLSAVEGMATLIGDVLVAERLGLPSVRNGNRDPLLAPHNVYRCRDGRWLAIAVANDAEWAALCACLGLRDAASDPRFEPAASRKAHEEDLDRLLAAALDRFDAADAARALQAAGVAATPVASARDLFEDPHLRAQGRWVTVEHPILGPREVMAPPWRLSATPTVLRRAAPLEGADEPYVYGELLGISAEQRAQLEAERVIY